MLKEMSARDISCSEAAQIICREQPEIIEQLGGPAAVQLWFQILRHEAQYHADVCAETSPEKLQAAPPQDEDHALREVYGAIPPTHIEKIGRCTYKVATAEGCFVSKVVTPHSHERVIADHFRSQGLERFCLPLRERFCSDRVLTWDFIPDAIDDISVFMRPPDESRELLHAVVSRLSELQAIPVDERVPPSAPIIDHEYFLALDLDAYESLPGFDVLEFVAAYQSVAHIIRALCQKPKSCFVHGDFKLDNILHDRVGERLVLIDWERSGLGACEVDLGNLIGSLLSRWISAKTLSYGGRYREILRGGGYWSAKQMFSTIEMLIRHFEACYCSHRRRSVPERPDVCLHAGLFLMNRAWVQCIAHGRQNLSSKMSFNLGLEIVKEPAKYVELFADAHEA